MTTADWIKLFVPIISNIFISGFVLTIILKKINDNFEKTKKREQYAYIVLGDIKKYLQNIRTQILYMQSGLVDDFKEGMIDLLKISGDFQVYIKEYKSYMVAASEKLGNEFFQVNKLEEISQELLNIGKSIGNPVEYANALNSALKITQEALVQYNIVLSEGYAGL